MMRVACASSLCPASDNIAYVFRSVHLLSATETKNPFPGRQRQLTEWSKHQGSVGYKMHANKGG